MNNDYRYLKLFLLFLLLVPAYILNAQNKTFQQYQYISPFPGSAYHNCETDIIIRQGELINSSTIWEGLIKVRGMKSGVHPGRLFLADDSRTLIFEPFTPFENGELVSVKLLRGISTLDGKPLTAFNFHFRISNAISSLERDEALLKTSHFNDVNVEYQNRIGFQNPQLNSGVPEDFPNIVIDKCVNPSQGFWFIAPFIYPGPSCFLAIIDDRNVPMYVERTPNRIYNFGLQPCGLLAYGDIVNRYYYVKDSSYALIDSFATGNGYLTDNHDFLLLENGHSFLLAYDPQQVRMDTVVQGGDSTAIVVGLIVQELDASKNVIFQWRSWDHYQITDATDDINLTAHYIDYVHGNTVELDFDGNLLISARNMDEITKINRQTGDIIWRFGGNKSRNNQFQFIDDPRTFSHQHDCRRLENGNITLYDNGTLHQPPYSRAVEYLLDESEMKATLIWQYAKDPPIFKTAMGNVQRLSNGNTIIGWGGWTNTPPDAFSEISNLNGVEFEASMPDTFTNYRAFKFPWRTSLFTTDEDSIFFESVAVGDSMEQLVVLRNNSPDRLEITEFYNSLSYFSFYPETPFVVSGRDTQIIIIKFKPDEEGLFNDVLHIRSDSEEKRIAQWMVIAGRTDTSFSNINDEMYTDDYNLEQNFPNPFNSSTTIKFSIPERQRVVIRIFDMLGNRLKTVLNKVLWKGNHSILFNVNDLPSGIYFYKISAGNFSDIKKMVLLK